MRKVLDIVSINYLSPTVQVRTGEDNIRYSVTCVAGRSMLNFLLFQFLAGHAPNASNTPLDISTGTGTSPVGQDAIPETSRGFPYLG